MATDVDVQYFSHLNGLTLGNNWGDLIRLLDIALVNGKTLPSITAASIDAQGDVHLTFFAAHQAMLLQVVEIEAFAPAELNQKYRIKGVPSNTQLILKPKNGLTVSTIATMGTAKLASLGYEIIFRDVNDVKRVYRAKNPTSQHPFIRVDESLASDIGTYEATYAKYAMVGLLEHMDHIDDYQNPDVLQLPFNPSDPAKNWKITGTGSEVVRGWSRWYWGKHGETIGEFWGDVTASAFNGKNFTLVGDSDAFYLQLQALSSRATNVVYGAGLFRDALKVANPSWFLMTTLRAANASTQYSMIDTIGGTPLLHSEQQGRFITTKCNAVSYIASHVSSIPLLPDYSAGATNIFGSNTVAALEIPFKDSDNYLRGVLNHVYYNGKNYGNILTTPIINEGSMYVADTAHLQGSSYFSMIYYLGELE